MIRTSTLLRLAVFLAATAALGGCVGAAVGGGAAVGVAAYEDRSVETVAEDLKIATVIRGKMLDKDPELAARVGVEVNEGRVLLTGVAKNERQVADVVRLAWASDGVKEVYNEIQLSGGGAMKLARDSWITAQLKSKLTFDKKIMAINYAIETVNGTVYLIGIAQNQAELDRVIAHARSISYVRRVISHVRVKQET